MSTKITVIFYIAICFEVGIVLLIVPWSDFWFDNFFLEYLVSRLQWQALVPFLQSGYVKGAVSGLGVVNLLICLWEIKNFRNLVATLSESEPEKKDDESYQN
ncbi:MAG: hypothetical protein HY819_15375 [Acidobacteria bacterium]|nr:hypothetical protein [Acidobacteriota bacterium]